MGVTENFLRPRPLQRQKTPLLENTLLFLFYFYQQSGSEKIAITTRRVKNTKMTKLENKLYH